MNSKNTVPILNKALEIIEYISSSPTPVSLPELQHNLGISQASCYRIVTTLMLHKWLEKRLGNRYDLSCNLTHICAKNNFHLEHYKALQPAMNNLVHQLGHQAKLSIRDGEDFINVCSAKNLSEHLIFSEPGFRTSIWAVTSVSTIFLSEEFSVEQHRQKLRPADFSRFRQLQQQYLQLGCCYIRGSLSTDSETTLDTLSFPVKHKDLLLGVISLIDFPGLLANDVQKAAELAKKPLKIISDLLKDLS